MALNLAAAHTNLGAFPAGAWEATARRSAVGPAFVPQSRRETIIEPKQTSQFDGLNPDALGGRIADGFRQDIDEKVPRGGAPGSFGGGFYGDYSDASLAVFSIAAFEAQLFVQDGEGTDQPVASHREGIHFYQEIQTVLERTLAVPTEAEDVIATDDYARQVNLLA